MAVTTEENRIHIGEKVVVRSALTDRNGVPINFADLVGATGFAYDVLGNRFDLTIVVGNVPTELEYEIETSTLREGDIRTEIRITYPSPDFSGGENLDVVDALIFRLYPLE